MGKNKLRWPYHMTARRIGGVKISMTGGVGGWGWKGLKGCRGLLVLPHTPAHPLVCWIDAMRQASVKCWLPDQHQPGMARDTDTREMEELPRCVQWIQVIWNWRDRYWHCTMLVYFFHAFQRWHTYLTHVTLFLFETVSWHLVSLSVIMYPYGHCGRGKW
jgi:hypothetical protein